MTDADEIAAAVDARERLAAWSRDTGTPKHGDLTQMDRRIAAMCEAQYRRQMARPHRELADYKRDFGDSKDRDR